MQNNYPIAKTITRTDTVPKCIINSVAADERLSFCDISGFGTFNKIKIEDAAGEVIEIDGPLDVLMIQGRIKREANTIDIELRCIVSKPTFNGMGVTGGKLLSGESSMLELTFTPLQNSETVESSTHSVQNNTDSNTTDNKWAQAVILSDKLQNKTNTKNENFSLPKQADFVLHRQFGQCKVIKISDDHISLQKPNGRIVQLGLRILKFYKDGEQNGKTIWKIDVNR